MIAAAASLWMRGRIGDEDRKRPGMQEMLERFVDHPEVSAMLAEAMATHEKAVSARRPVPPEMMLGPQQIERERLLLLDEIHSAFKDVSREGGVSWSESDVIDDYGSDEERASARALDKDASWTQLVDDPKWNPEPGIGGFSFMDAIGFRYYLPAAMIRCVRSGHDEGIQFHLDVGGSTEELHAHNVARVAALDQRQRRCVAMFLRYMVAVSSQQDDYEAKAWLAALDSHWAEAK